MGHFNSLFVPAVGYLPVSFQTILMPGGGGGALLEVTDTVTLLNQPNKVRGINPPFKQSTKTVVHGCTQLFFFSFLFYRGSAASTSCQHPVHGDSMSAVCNRVLFSCDFHLLALS